MFRLFKNSLNPSFLSPRGATSSHVVVPPPARFSSSKHSPYAGIKNPKLKTMVRQIQGFMRAKPDVEPTGFIFKKLKALDASTVPPHIAFEAIIDLLIHLNRTETAAAVLQGMHNEGFASSTPIDAKLVAIALALPPQPDDQLEEYLAVKLATMVKDPGFVERDLSALVQLMQRLRINRTMVALVVESFRDERGEGYSPKLEILPPMVEASVRAGNVEAALSMVKAAPRKQGPAARRSILIAYTQMLTAMRDTNTWSDAAVSRVLEGIDERGLVPNIQIANLLLSRAVRSKNYPGVPPLYALLRDMQAAEGIAPDAYTFGTLFEMWEVLLLPNSPQYAQVAPRTLFRDFMLATKTTTTPIAPTIRLLNLILNAFMRQRDYAGAFVVLSAFPHLRLSLNHTTYYTVVKRIVHRVWKDTASPRRVRSGQVKWADCFLGVPFEKVELKEGMVGHILWLVSLDKWGLKEPMYPLQEASTPSATAAAATVDADMQPRLAQERDAGTERRVKYKMPTMHMMESVLVPEPLDFVYDPTPVKRLLRRAMLADIILARSNSGSPTLDGQENDSSTTLGEPTEEETSVSAREVSEAVRQAKAEMIPS